MLRVYLPFTPTGNTGVTQISVVFAQANAFSAAIKQMAKSAT